jgi:hypothetical protein
MEASAISNLRFLSSSLVGRPPPDLLSALPPPPSGSITGDALTAGAELLLPLNAEYADGRLSAGAITSATIGGAIARTLNLDIY